MKSTLNTHNRIKRSQDTHFKSQNKTQIATMNEDLNQNKAKLLTYVRDNVIGSNTNTLLRTVYGVKPHFYCDYTASGKSLKFIENYFT